MIESEVVAVFAAWLSSQGWSVRTEVDFADVAAERDGVTLLAEAKGTTSSPGLDVDTGYGQLLRRISPGEGARLYALVVPASARKAAERVRREVRAMLKINVYVVATDGTVELI